MNKFILLIFAFVGQSTFADNLYSDFANPGTRSGSSPFTRQTSEYPWSSKFVKTCSLLDSILAEHYRSMGIDLNNPANHDKIQVVGISPDERQRQHEYFKKAKEQIYSSPVWQQVSQSLSVKNERLGSVTIFL